MRATAVIARREVLELVRDGRLLWAGGLMVVLLLTSLAVGGQRQAVLRSEREAAQALDYEDWLAQGDRHPHDAAHQGMHVFKPEPALSIIDPGVGPYVGSTQWLKAHRQSETKFRPAHDATGLQRFGSLSPAWVLQVLGPLLIIVLGFGALAGEREQGTLRQLLSLGIASRTLLWGKASGLALAAAALLLPCGLAVAGVVLWQSGPSERVDALLRLLGLGLGYAVYFASAIFVVIAVSARARTARLALTSLLGAWIVGVVVLPRAISDLAAKLDPAPTRTQFSRTLDREVGEAQGRVWREEFGVQQGWGPDLPLAQWGIALQRNDAVSYDVLDRQFAALWDTFERQQRTQELAGLVAPVLAVRSFSMALAGTDFAQHREFSAAAERHRRLIQDVMSHDLVEHADPLGDQHFTYDAGPELWAQVPPFEYAPPDGAFALRHAWPSFAVLLVFLAVSAALALASAPRRPALS